MESLANLLRIVLYVAVLVVLGVPMAFLFFQMPTWFIVLGLAALALAIPAQARWERDRKGR